MIFSVVIFGMLSVISAMKLPNYIKPCSLKDPNLNQCIKEHANEAIPTIVKGDKKYKLISFSPFKSPEIILDSGDNLKIKLTDVSVFNFDKLKIVDVNLDYQKRHLMLTASTDSFSLEGKYDIKGQIMILPITGNGKIRSSVYGGIYKYDVDFEEVEINGQTYLNIVNSSVDYTMQKASFYFENLFNGNKILGDQMNKFLEENWEVLADETKPALAATIRSILDSVITTFFKAVPLKDFFLN